MERASFKVSAPGSVMLMGEHAVLNGSRCIVLAIDKRISMVCTPIRKRVVRVDSMLGSSENDLDAEFSPPPHQFAVEPLRHLAEQLPSGLHIDIQSDVPADAGLGSSAAVTVAATAAARRLARLDCSQKMVMEAAISAVRSVQGAASGADAAASALGGVVGYRTEPSEAFRVAKGIPIALANCGYKRTTSEVINIVNGRKEKFAEGFNLLFELVNETVSEALQAIENEDLERVGFLMNFNQGLMDSMGVNNFDLATIIYALRNCSGIYGAKISGSGLGDCVVGLGDSSGIAPEVKILEVHSSDKGLSFD